MPPSVAPKARPSISRFAPFGDPERRKASAMATTIGRRATARTTVEGTKKANATSADRRPARIPPLLNGTRSRNQ